MSFLLNYNGNDTIAIISHNITIIGNNALGMCAHFKDRESAISHTTMFRKQCVYERGIWQYNSSYISTLWKL